MYHPRLRGHSSARALLEVFQAVVEVKRKTRGLAQGLDRAAREFGEMALIVLPVVFNHMRAGPDTKD